MPVKKPFFITTPIYYVNDAPHLGSAYTTIAADVLARFLRGSGEEVFFLTGTDEHGKKISDSAQAARQEPVVFAAKVAQIFKKTWLELGISNDAFIRTTDPRHVQNVQHHFRILKEQGALYQDTYRGLYCTQCEEYKQPKDLCAGLCCIHRTAPEELKEAVWFFRLGKYAPAVKAAIQNNSLRIEPQSRRNEVLQWLKEEVRDLAVTRSKVSWGIPLPWDHTQTIYVWADALFNYHTAGAQVWPPDLHLMGKDIVRFHAIIWPALLLALKLPLPKKIYAHGFFTVSGQKMSKTLKNVIDPVEISKKYGHDAVRYFLLREFPFGQDGDFSEKALRRRYESDLQHGLGNLVQRTLTMERTYKVNVPKGIAPRCAQADEHTRNLAFDRALIELWRLIQEADVLIDTEKPWELARTNRPRLITVVTSLHRRLETIAASLQPYLPETTRKLRAQLLGARVKPLFPPLT